MDKYNIPPSCQVKGLNEIYLKYFGYTEHGWFVEVGAYDGYQFSNTWGLAVAGWGGLMFEPVPEYFQACAQNHKGHRAVCVANIAIGNFIGTTEFTVAGSVSTLDKHQLETDFWKNEYAGGRKITVSVLPLDKALFAHSIRPNFDVFSLDVEGGESDVLKSFDVNYWKPRMAIVEAQEHHPALELTLQAPFINQYFADAGYDKIYSDDINNIYVRKDFWDAR